MCLPVRSVCAVKYVVCLLCVHMSLVVWSELCLFAFYMLWQGVLLGA